MIISTLQNNNIPNFKTSFKAYTPQQICAELCKGACCDHGTMMNGVLKKFTDRLCSQYKTMPDNLKSAVLIKTPIVKWAVSSQNPDVISINNLANAYIDAISRETDKTVIQQLEAILELLNEKLCELLGDNETFCAVTNKDLANSSNDDIVTAGTNICMYKDHGKTNLCTIYHGIENSDGSKIERPSVCIKVGSDELPCPWHHPEKYAEICSKIGEALAYNGYGILPEKVIAQYVAQQYNLNETFIEKIWTPYIKSLDKSI